MFSPRASQFRRSAAFVLRKTALQTFGGEMMRKLAFSFLVTILLSLVTFGQSPVQTNSGSDQEEVMKVLAEYSKAMQTADAKERDRMRESLLTEDYFYMGIDGIPVTKKQVMARQTRNSLQINSIKTANEELKFYEGTAILTMRYTNSGVDKGQPFSGTTGFVIVLVKDKGTWRIAADIVGREIKN